MKLKMIVGFVSLALIAIVGSILAKDGSEKVNPNVAIKKAVINLNAGELQTFFDSVEKFSREYSFAFRVAPTAPTGKDYIVELWREDFKVLAANPFDAGEFRLSVFNISGKPLDTDLADKLLADLERHLSLELPEIRMTQEAGNI